MSRGAKQSDLLVANALELFAKHTVSGTSLQMIANSLGVTKASIYYHFPSKDALVRAVVAPALGTLSNLTTQAAEISGGAARRRFLVSSLARHAVENRDLYSVVLRDVSLGALIEWDAKTERSFEDLRRFLIDDPNNVQERTAASFFLSGLTAPSSDPALAELADDELYDSLVEAGHRLLNIPPGDDGSR